MDNDKPYWEHWLEKQNEKGVAYDPFPSWGPPSSALLGDASSYLSGPVAPAERSNVLPFRRKR